MNIHTAMFAGLAFTALGCQATVKHEVEPIHITVDVNIRVDRQLDDFFDFQDKSAPVKETPKDDSPNS